MFPLVLCNCWHPDIVINAAGPWLLVAHVRGEHITFSSGLCLNTFSQRNWDAFQSNQAFCRQSTMPGGPVMPAAHSAALPSCRGAQWNQPQDVAGGDPDEIPCSHKCTLKGAAPSIPCAASDVGSAQVREERAQTMWHLKRHLGISEPPWLPAERSSRSLWYCICFPCCDDSGQMWVTEGASGGGKQAQEETGELRWQSGKSPLWWRTTQHMDCTFLPGTGGFLEVGSTAGSNQRSGDPLPRCAQGLVWWSGASQRVRRNPKLLSAAAGNVVLESQKVPCIPPLCAGSSAVGLPELAGSWEALRPLLPWAAHRQLPAPLSAEPLVQHRWGQGHFQGSPELHGGKMLLQDLAGFS